jgi:hypothetical protein
MSGTPGVRAPVTGEYPAPEEDQGVMVVIDVQGSSRAKHLTVVKQAVAVKNGKLTLVGPKKEERVETFKWIT